MRGGYWRYWGKADAGGQDGPCWHPLAYHCLDVAACGATLLENHPTWLAKLESLAGIQKDKLKPWLLFLLALHDIGKFCEGFQRLPGNPFGLEVTVAYDLRHDVLGYAVAMEHLPAWLRRLHGDELDHLVASPWFCAVTGHHGRPPKDSNTRAVVQRHFPDAVLQDASTYTAEVKELLCPDGWCLPEPEPGVPERQQKASWLVAGLTVLADWLGSNTRWFPYESPGYSLDDYWKRIALPRSHRAVTESGLAGVKPARDSGFAQLFPALMHTPTPLQAWADDVAFADGPQLFILEELTGAGKTEAALTLAARLMASGKADGVYFALPTMATADAMFNRMRQGDEEVWRRFFEEGEPSLVLAHSAAKTARKLEALRMEPDAGYGVGREEPSASQSGAVWLADSRKKALLADFGVGTIDQALLAILQLRHQSLRLLGLSGKVLVVDEVHACDCYMSELLGRLLQFHAALGGSAILLSATLPKDQRARLLARFAQGAGAPAREPEKRNDYPLATHFHAGGFVEQPIQARASVTRTVFVDALTDEEAIFQRLHAGTQSGGCAAWVRNTVADALDACLKWRERHPNIHVILFHARFALCDRLRIGEEVSRNFGPGSRAETRRGKLVIATQVVEQSLDVDFDDLVTDLAPMDLVIQRAGRLRRHKRDRHGNPAEREARGDARLGVLAPMPAPEAVNGWYRQCFPKAAAVYADHGRLWLTARWLTERGQFTLPEDVRGMIEGVYGEEGYDGIPDGLKKSSDKKHGACQSERAIARQNALGFDQGYTSTGNNTWPDEDTFTEIGTRLGDKTVRIRLARRQGDRLTSWATTGSDIDWPLSELTVAWRLIAGESPRNKTLLDQARKEMADEGKYCVIVPLEATEQDWQGWAVNPDGNEIRVIYSEHLGLRIEQGEAANESDL